MIQKLLFLLIPLSLNAQSIENDHELLWEISGNGLENKSYLFGSFHSNDKRLFNLSDSTFYALSRADVIALETDVFSLFDEWDTRIDDVRVKYDNEGKPYVSTAEPTETHYGNEDGMPQFLDAFFQQYCYNANKEFAQLEDVDFQLNLLSDIDVGDFTKVRLQALLTDKDAMLEMYLTGDIYQLDEMLRSSLSLFPQGYEKLITDRNFTMSSMLDSLLQKNKSTFCAVGAGHLAGGSGMINLLRGKGYSLRRVNASFSEESTDDRKAIFAERIYAYDNDTLGLHVRFPGKPMEITNSYDEYDLKLVYREYGQGNCYEVEVYPLTEEIGLEKIAENYIASPAESPLKKITLDNGGIAYQGLADSYPEGLYWARVIMTEESFVVIKTYGGNKFMNSNRAQRFFEQVWFE